MLQNINHGVSTGALFLLVGWIYERRHTRAISELKGLQAVAPIFAAGFTIVMLSSIGVPGLNGFVGEYLVLIGSFLSARWWAVAAAAGVILAALYLLWAYQRVFHGEPDDANTVVRRAHAGARARCCRCSSAIIVFTGRLPEAAHRPRAAERRRADRPHRGPRRRRHPRSERRRRSRAPARAST